LPHPGVAQEMAQPTVGIARGPGYLGERKARQVEENGPPPPRPEPELHGPHTSSPSPSGPIETRGPKGPVQGPEGGPPYLPAHQVAQEAPGATDGGPQEPVERNDTINAPHTLPLLFYSSHPMPSPSWSSLWGSGGLTTKLR